MPRPRSLLDEEKTVVEARRPRGWFYCSLPKKDLKFLDKGDYPDGLTRVRQQGERSRSDRGGRRSKGIRKPTRRVSTIQEVTPEPSKPTRSWPGSDQPPKRNKALHPTTSPLWGGAEDFFWRSETPLLPDYSLKGEEDRCEEDCQEKLSSRASLDQRARIWWTTRWSRRRGGLNMWLKKGQGTSRIASRLHGRVVSSSGWLREQLKVKHEATLPQALEKDFCNWEITGSSKGRSFVSWRELI